MPGALKATEPEAEEIDMDRVVSDPDYRRTIIFRLRRERLLKTQTAEPDPDLAADED